MQYVKIRVIVALLAIFWLLGGVKQADASVIYQQWNNNSSLSNFIGFGSSVATTSSTGFLGNPVDIWVTFELYKGTSTVNNVGGITVNMGTSTASQTGCYFDGTNSVIQPAFESMSIGERRILTVKPTRQNASHPDCVNGRILNITAGSPSASYWRMSVNSLNELYGQIDFETPPPSNTETYFISTEISTTTGTVTASGHIGTQWPNSYVDFSQDNILYGNWVNISLFREQTGFFTAVFNYNPITSTSTEGFNSQIFNLSIKNYTGCESGFGQDLSCPPGQPILASTSTNLVLDPNENPAFWGSPDFFAGLLPEAECSIFSGDGVMACFRNFSIWAFSMSSSSAYKYDELKTLVSTKYPLAPLVYVGQQISSFNASSTPTESFLIPDWIKTNIVDPMRTGLGILLVGFHLLVLYRWGHKINFT